MNWIPEINNVNQLIGFIANVVTIISVSGIVGYTVFNYEKIVSIYKRIINVSVTYNIFRNFSLIYSPKTPSRSIYPEGIRPDLHNIKVK